MPNDARMQKHGVEPFYIFSALFFNCRCGNIKFFTQLFFNYLREISVQHAYYDNKACQQNKCCRCDY